MASGLAHRSGAHRGAGSRPRAARRSRSGPPPGARETLLAAARDLMAERGSGHVSIRQIARRAGANLSQIYYYFGSKESLRAAVLYEAIASFDPTRASGRTDFAGRADEVVESIMSAMHDRLAAAPLLPRLMLRELAGEGPELRRIAEDLILPRLRRLEAIMQAGQRAGIVRRGDRRVQAAACAALILHWHLFRPILIEFGLDVLDLSGRRTIAAETTRILRSGLFTGPRHRPRSRRKG